jgi:hypothetical protein
MLRVVISFLLLCQLFACVKKQLPPSPEPEPAKPPTVKFVFVNRLGYRNDSTRHGFNDTIFQGLCMDLKYFDKKANLSYLDGFCYNRNFPANNYPLSDSIVFGLPNREYPATVGSQYQLIIDLIWRRTNLMYTKGLRYHSIRYPQSDTIKFARDTIIKFVWPNDTASGKYIKGVII